MKKKVKLEDPVESDNTVEPSDEENGTDSDEGYEEEFEDVVASDTDVKEIAEVPYKRKNKEESENPKKRKRGIKPPSAEEMIRLRETENLYQSNLFRLQIEEMINELKPRKTDKNAIKHWLQSFKQFLAELEDGERLPVNDQMHVTDEIILPLDQKNWQIDDDIKFLKPIDVQLYGSYANGTVMGPYFVLDVIIIIPKKYFHKEDYLNQKYHYKRAFYLSIIASHIKKSQLVSQNYDMKFWLKNGDHLKPVLLFRPQGRMTEYVEIALSILPEDSQFNSSRFSPDKNNIRPEWWGSKRKSNILPSTPYYNMSILEDIVAAKNEQLKLETFDGNQNLKDAVVLLGVWLKQRKLSEGFGAFNIHLLTMFMVYLIKKQKINNFMSSYQIARNVWLSFTNTDWTKEGLSLCMEDPAPCSLETFHNYFDVVFIDATGQYNLCNRLNRLIYFRIREESEKAITYLNDTNINGFQVLFMINMPFIQQYDNIISFTDPEIIENTVVEHCDKEQIMDRSGQTLSLFINLVSNILKQGIGNRLNYFCVYPANTSKWLLNEEGTGAKFNDLLLFGLKLNPETALNIIDKGPSPNEEEAKKFREFWGDKCELRRFRDGSVCESVCWNTSEAKFNARRVVVKMIVDYLLKEKLNISSNSYCYVANQFDSLIVNKFQPKSSHEEASQAVHKIYENLSRQLIDLSNLPLSIVSVRCISPVYRFTEVFPPLPSTHSLNKKLCTISNRGVIFKLDENVTATPFYVEPIDLVVQMELSQKWPNDLKAGKRLIAAFNIVLASSLKKKYKLNCQITSDNVIIQKDGYIFRLHLGYSKEIGLLKKQITELGITYYRDTPDSILLEKKFINLPKVSGALYGLSQTYSCYGYATCIAKRWINSHMLDDFHFPSLIIELLMARLFVYPQPYDVAIQPLTQFLRFLNFISTTNWQIEPVIINFNNILTRGQITEIEKSFQSNRDTLPPLVIPTPYDINGTLWTKDAPTLATLIRLSKLAATSLKMLEVFLTTSPLYTNILKVFETPLSHYDVIITLNKKLLPRRLQRIKVDWETQDRQPALLPIAGFDPALMYLNELREKYNKYALFFHDSYGGCLIGVLFKPSFLEAVDFKISNVGPRIPTPSDGKISLQPNKEALINGFYLLGAGLVENIEIR